jgi:hypothetical protein
VQEQIWEIGEGMGKFTEHPALRSAIETQFLGFVWVIPSLDLLLAR